MATLMMNILSRAAEVNQVLSPMSLQLLRYLDVRFDLS